MLFSKVKSYCFIKSSLETNYPITVIGITLPNVFLMMQRHFPLLGLCNNSNNWLDVKGINSCNFILFL
jgi:hypothetical protein